MRWLDYFFFLRPVLFFPGWSTMLLGAWYAFALQNGSYPELFVMLFPFLDVMLLLLAFAAVMGASFVLNQISDADTDRINEKLHFIPRGMIGPRIALIYGGLLAFAGLLIFAIFFQGAFIAALLFFVLTGIFYNFGAFALKQSLLGGFIANLLMGLLAFAIGFTAFIDLSLPALALSAWPLGLVNSGLYLLTTLQDKSGDEQTGKQTVATIFGESRSLRGAALLVASGSVFLPLTSWGALFLLPVVVFVPALFWQTRLQTGIYLLRTMIIIQGLAVSLYWPWFLLMGGMIFVLSRYYYARRFGMVYPRIKQL
jgi:4-hydroxybenzoate polyprenyltransferase